MKSVQGVVLKTKSRTMQNIRVDSETSQRPGQYIMGLPYNSIIPASGRRNTWRQTWPSFAYPLPASTLGSRGRKGGFPQASPLACHHYATLPSILRLAPRVALGSSSYSIWSRTEPRPYKRRGRDTRRPSHGHRASQSSNMARVSPPPLKCGSMCDVYHLSVSAT